MDEVINKLSISIDHLKQNGDFTLDEALTAILILEFAKKNRKDFQTFMNQILQEGAKKYGH
jgi:hypothetical protein